MERHNLSLHLAIALKNHEIRRACTATEHILCAIEILDDLPPEALEVVRDYCDDYNNRRTGAFSDFERGYIALVADHLNATLACASAGCIMGSWAHRATRHKCARRALLGY
jgi:DNA-binding transcriptional LysR family regulator